MGKGWNKQYVWPKDGPKGRGHRGFFGRLDNIVTNRGPDIFVQRKGSKEAIRPETWGNWDSYHAQDRHLMEECNLHPRGFHRYDPHTRRYELWATPHDWRGDGLGTAGIDRYPRFTQSEGRRLGRQLQRGKIDLSKMGKDWHPDGPKRFRQEHDWFWQEAHRLGENFYFGLDPKNGINQYLRLHQQGPDDVDRWIFDELT